MSYIKLAFSQKKAWCFIGDLFTGFFLWIWQDSNCKNHAWIIYVNKILSDECISTNWPGTRICGQERLFGTVIFNHVLMFTKRAAQRMKFSIKNFFSKCDQIRRKLRIWSHLLKKFLMENLSFCAVAVQDTFKILQYLLRNF